MHCFIVRRFWTFNFANLIYVVQHSCISIIDCDTLLSFTFTQDHYTILPYIFKFQLIDQNYGTGSNVFVWVIFSYLLYYNCFANKIIYMYIYKVLKITSEICKPCTDKPLKGLSHIQELGLRLALSYKRATSRRELDICRQLKYISVNVTP